jgi:molybdopterin-containing oxidoreductase family membrane subunit
MCKITLLTSCIVGLAYATELFIGWYSASPYEHFVSLNRLAGPYGPWYILMLACNVLVPQAFWFEKVRRNPLIIFAIAILINVGMWLERFVIIVISLHRDYVPSSWIHYTPTYVEVGTFIGSLGLFFACFFLFVRFLPVIALGEVKGVLGFARRKEGGES